MGDRAGHLEAAVDGVVALRVPRAGAVGRKVGAERAGVVVADHGLAKSDQAQGGAATQKVALFGLSQGGRGDHGVAGEDVAGPGHRPQHVEVLNLVEGFDGRARVALAAAADGGDVAAPAQVLLVRQKLGRKEVTFSNQELHKTDVTLKVFELCYAPFMTFNLYLQSSTP